LARLEKIYRRLSNYLGTLLVTLVMNKCFFTSVVTGVVTGFAAVEIGEVGGPVPALFMARHTGFVNRFAVGKAAFPDVHGQMPFTGLESIVACLAEGFAHYRIAFTKLGFHGAPGVETGAVKMPTGINHLSTGQAHRAGPGPLIKDVGKAHAVGSERVNIGCRDALIAKGMDGIRCLVISEDKQDIERLVSVFFRNACATHQAGQCNASQAKSE